MTCAASRETSTLGLAAGEVHLACLLPGQAQQPLGDQRQQDLGRAAGDAEAAGQQELLHERGGCRRRRPRRPVRPAQAPPRRPTGGARPRPVCAPRRAGRGPRRAAGRARLGGQAATRPCHRRPARQAAAGIRDLPPPDRWRLARASAPLPRRPRSRRPSPPVRKPASSWRSASRRLAFPPSNRRARTPGQGRPG